MSGRICFEMNDKERQLNLIGQMIDYAICTFSEGLGGTGEYRIKRIRNDLDYHGCRS